MSITSTLMFITVTSTIPALQTAHPDAPADHSHSWVELNTWDDLIKERDPFWNTDTTEGCGAIRPLNSIRHLQTMARPDDWFIIHDEVVLGYWESLKGGELQWTPMCIGNIKLYDSLPADLRW